MKERGRIREGRVIIKPDEDPHYLQDIFQFAGDRYYYKIKHNPPEFLVMDAHSNKIYLTKIQKAKQLHIETPIRTLGRFAIHEWEDHTPLLSDDRRFSCKIATADGKQYCLRNKTISEFLEFLKNWMLITDRNFDYTTISALYQTLSELGKIKRTEYPAYPGFFLINNKLISTLRKYSKPKKEELRGALEVLNQLAKRYEGLEGNVAYIIKWFMLAPFNYARKQYGSSNKMSILYSYGTSRAGKTILGLVGLKLWKLMPSEFQLGVGEINTAARFGRAISNTTYPVVVDEGEQLFQGDINNPIVDIVKNATFSLKARGRYNMITKQYEEIPALSLLYITSNVTKPTKAELAARVDSISFFMNRVRTEKEMEEFNKMFKVEAPHGPLTKLQYIGEYTAWYHLQDILLLEQPWNEVADNILESMYDYAGLGYPDWLQKEPNRETIQDAFISETDDFISELSYLLTRKVQMAPQVGKGQISYVTLEEQIKYAVENSLEPWIHLIKKEDDNYVIITGEFTRVYYNEFRKEIDMKVLANRIGGKFKIIRKNRVDRRLVMLRYSDFLELFNITDDVLDDIKTESMVDVN